MLTSDMLLPHYNPTLAADGSNHGVGTVISHVFPNDSKKTVAYASQTLTIGSNNCSQIKEQIMGIIFAVKGSILRSIHYHTNRYCKSNYTNATDNSTQFSSALFQDFYWSHNITHLYNLSCHLQSNDQIERFIGALKEALHRSRWEGKAEGVLDVFLLMYRTTRHPTLNNHSPTETPTGQKSGTIHNALPPKNSTFSNSSSCPVKTLATGTAVYMRDHQ
ncbi:unnamed protein product [Hymenolepis diminuta]|uniref:Integrase catalytic domain-containing protein n=1 Tax=Hymenolepis diminuta TaxID=6216 RepID=A0A564YR69_HYMDI|nr:unnamed protein product [Hymenolepis diminuta]